MHLGALGPRERGGVIDRARVEHHHAIHMAGETAQAAADAAGFVAGDDDEGKRIHSTMLPC